jgi:hypothetical protein
MNVVKGMRKLVVPGDVLRLRGDIRRLLKEIRRVLDVILKRLDVIPRLLDEIQKRLDQIPKHPKRPVVINTDVANGIVQAEVNGIVQVVAEVEDARLK